VERLTKENTELRSKLDATQIKLKEAKKEI